MFVTSGKRKLMRPVSVASPLDLDQHHTFITLSNDHPLAKMLADYLSTHKVRFARKLSLHSIAGVKEAVRNDDGVSILPEPTVRQDCQEGRLKAIPLKYGLVRSVFVIYRSDSLSRPPVSAFLDRLSLAKNLKI